jgi:dipeptidyl aminopeptidase/acylaminoacyl peptidase
MKLRKTPLALIVGAFVLATALPTQAQQLFTPYQVAQLRSVTAVEISPDSKHIAYILVVPRDPFDGEDGPAWQELHLIDESGHSRPYVSGAVKVEKIAWTPDGQGVSFLAKREGEEQKSLYVIPLEGGEASKVVGHETDITEYSWAPDGKRVAFLAKETEPEDKKELKEKGFNQIVFEEDLRPVRVWIANTADKDSEPQKLPLEGSASSLRWSPVASKLALALAPTPLVDDGYMNRRIRIVDAENGNILARIENPGKLGAIAWSPDGEHLALVSAADPHDPKEGRLMVVSSSSDELRDLLPDYDAGHVSSVAWRDADTLLFTVNEGVWSFLAKVDVNGTGFTRITPTEGPILKLLSVSQDGQAAAFRGDTPTHPYEVYSWKPGDDVPVRVTHSNPWLQKMTLAKQEVVQFKARDGLELEGILIHPVRGQASASPLILTVHGGPESHFSNGWLTAYSRPGQVAAARGFAVFYPNYRGSTGRGVEFSKLSQADAAGKEFDDLIDAVDHLVANGLVDRARVGITGGSYGGYASAWGATRFSDRFAASVMFVGISDNVSKVGTTDIPYEMYMVLMFVGISDNVSKVGTTDIPYEMYMVHHRKWLWDDWDYFRERSPLKYVAKARTPILILGGTDDPRVHPSQSLELYRQLKLLDQAPVRLVRYPGEKHGNRRAASRLDYNMRMIRWMVHYLIGPGGDPPPPELDYGPAVEGEPTDGMP